ncbi:delta-60 repeat domain-containing protein [Flavobacterium pallidum]|uniref:Secretion system C-terminal sorting domain-containing protein n=1 Tax=Flavobacterium pallidum TaxID=2172098 RepID=A0A2S1SHM5_9FLAO|nr:delta-60 repeat domain-containing protein [Flavobacterium pallidum]AWI25914.1 hypothetical protein HYN49_08380 [Flavobacterium pallidum]
MKNKTILTLLISTLLTISAFSQSWVNDPSFNPQDEGYWNGANNTIYVNAVQPDNRIVISGSFTRYKDYDRNRIARINPDESLDLSFDPGTGPNDYISAIVLQPDGKIIIGGNFTTYNDIPVNHIARLNANGSLDSSFNTGTGANDVVSSILLLPDGKIVAGGYFTAFNANNYKRIVKLNTDGSVDGSFTTGTGFNGNVRGLALQADGKILAVGEFFQYNSQPSDFIVRLHEDGTRDVSFTPASINDIVTKTLAQADGKIIITGEFSSVNAVQTGVIARLNSDGSLDSGFNVPITPVYNTITDAVFTPAGKLIVAGYFSTNGDTYAHNICRLNMDGSLDETFYSRANNLGFFSDLSLQSDGNIIVTGSFDYYDKTNKNRFARLHEDGTINIDIPVNAGTGADNYIRRTIVQPDEKILVTGRFTHFNGSAQSKIVRLLPDGDVDPDFNTGTGFNDDTRVMALQADGKILVAGNFTSFNGQEVNKFVRLSPDGSMDSAFIPNIGFDPTITNIGVQSDGKIILTGVFYFTVDFSVHYGVIRLNIDGSIDQDFMDTLSAIPASLLADQVSLLITPDDKIVLGRQSGFTNNAILLRLNSDGSQDLSFTPAVGLNFEEVTSMSLQPDGKIVFVKVGSGTYTLLRINGDGTTDNSFLSGNSVSISGSFNKILVQQDGKMILSGSFTTYNGIPRFGLVRLNSNGSVDESFSINSVTFANSIGGYIFDIAFQSGKVIACGEFAFFGNTGRNRITRIMAADDLSTGNMGDVLDNDIRIYKDSGILNIKSLSSNISTVSIYDLSGKLVLQSKRLDKNEVSIQDVLPSNSFLIVKIMLADNSMVTKKFCF